MRRDGELEEIKRTRREEVMEKGIFRWWCLVDLTKWKNKSAVFNVKRTSSTSGFSNPWSLFSFVHPSVLSHRFLQTLNSFSAVWNTHGAANKHGPDLWTHTSIQCALQAHAQTHVRTYAHIQAPSVCAHFHSVCSRDHETSNATHKTVDSCDSVFLWIQKNCVLQAGVHNEVLAC